MNKLIKLATAVAVVSAVGSHGAEDANLSARLAQLEAVVQRQDAAMKQQEAEIAALRGQALPSRELISDLVTAEVDARIDRDLAEGLAALKADGGVLTLGKGIDGLKLSGDVRFRYQFEESNVAGSDSLDRYRLRLRAGGVWTNKAENWEFGLGFEVGDPRAVSPNTDFSKTSPFDSQDVFLDFAYVKNKLDAFSLSIGQFKNPFETTSLNIDADVRPVGVAAQFADGGIFATVAVLDVLSQAAVTQNAESLAVGGQIGFKGNAKDLGYLLALGYLHYNSVTLERTTNGTPNELQILDLLGKANTTIGSAKVELWGQIGVNLGADGTSAQSQAGVLPGGDTPGDQDLFYGIGVAATVAKYSAGYAWKHIEADSIFRTLGDSNFGASTGGSTNVEGHELKLGYAITPSISLGATAHLYSDILSIGADEGAIYQFDVLYKF